MLPQRPIAHVFLGLGSNQGDRLAHLRRTEAELLERRVTVVRSSSILARCWRVSARAASYMSSA